MARPHIGAGFHNQPERTYVLGKAVLANGEFA